MKRLSYLLLPLVLAPHLAHAQDNDESHLLSLSLQELTNIEVTSVSKKSEKASEAAAAVFVITPDDIRRSGSTTIPEVLRIVPGLDVAQMDANQWAISSRGSNGQFANKLLVLIDGRSVYTPLFAGVWWGTQDTLLEDIDRIEVIRGPGGALWGANAVNGVINIITKSAKDTLGGLVSLTSGTQDKAIAGGRYGVKFADEGYARAYAKYKNRDEVRTLANLGAGDEMDDKQAGFRADWKEGDNGFSLHGDVYNTFADFNLNLPSFVTPPAAITSDTTKAKGANILGKWTHEISKFSELALQAYFDNAERRNQVYKSAINTFDLDLQHTYTGISRNEIIWGLGYRRVENEAENTFYYQQTPESRQDDLFSALVQDKIAIVQNELFLTLGSKFEHNDYTGFEVQPNARFTWLVNDKQTVWGAVSRAVRTPNLFTDDGQLKLQSFTVPGNGFVVSQGNHDLDSESLIAYELGHRAEITPNLFVDSTVFYNDYDKLFTGNLGAAYAQLTGPLAPFLVQPIPVTNQIAAHSYGFETAVNWEVTEKWKLTASYSFIDLKFDGRSIGFSAEGLEPEQQFNIRSVLLLPYNLEMDNALYYVDNITGLNIPDYVRFDTRISWKATDGIELSLVGQNLLDPVHPEFSGFVYQSPTQIPRSVYGNVTFKF